MGKGGYDNRSAKAIYTVSCVAVVESYKVRVYICYLSTSNAMLPCWAADDDDGSSSSKSTRRCCCKTIDVPCLLLLLLLLMALIWFAAAPFFIVSKEEPAKGQSKRHYRQINQDLNGYAVAACRLEFETRFPPISHSSLCDWITRIPYPALK